MNEHHTSHPAAGRQAAPGGRAEAAGKHAAPDSWHRGLLRQMGETQGSPAGAQKGGENVKENPPPNVKRTLLTAQPVGELLLTYCLAGQTFRLIFLLETKLLQKTVKRTLFFC